MFASSAALPLTGNAGTGSYATRLKVAKGIAYVLNIPQESNQATVSVVDINDSAAPKLLTMVSIPPHWMFGGWGFDGTHFGMELIGDRLYVGGYYGVVVIDLTDPKSPDPIGVVDPRSYVGGIAGLDGELAVAYSKGLAVIEILPITK